MQKKEKKYYHAALYLRISRDDEEVGQSKVESNSIRSQRDMIHAFLRRQDDIEIYRTYIDDGCSGVTFDRPAFQQMMKDIKVGNINLVVVKDLSRLGRDYIEVGRLIQKTFPAFSVRFIAINDHFDTLTANDNETAWIVPVKNFINDSYCRDISNKVRSHQKVKRENGEFIGAFCVYGYKKSGSDKTILIPDEYAAAIVKKIFLWKLEGYSTSAIAGYLNELGVLSPMEYKKYHGENFQSGFSIQTNARWSAVAIKRILVNEIYLGNLVQGKEETISYKIKKRRKKSKEEWTRVENTHKAIITKEDYKIVQELLQVDTRAAQGEKKAHKYAGLLYCGDCKAAMVRRVNRVKDNDVTYFICSTCNRGKGCSRHSITESALDKVILTELKQQSSLFMDAGYVSSHIQKIEVPVAEAALLDKEIGKLSQEWETYQHLKRDLYEDWKQQVITEEDYQSFQEIYEKQADSLQQRIKKQEKMRDALFCSGITAGIRLEHLKESMQVLQLDRMTLLTFVRRILIYEDKRISVQLRYKEQL